MLTAHTCFTLPLVSGTAFSGLQEAATLDNGMSTVTHGKGDRPCLQVELAMFNIGGTWDKLLSLLWFPAVNGGEGRLAPLHM